VGVPFSGSLSSTPTLLQSPPERLPTLIFKRPASRSGKDGNILGQWQSATNKLNIQTEGLWRVEYAALNRSRTLAERALEHWASVWCKSVSFMSPCCAMTRSML
jgi:hypothetical protein